MEGLLSFLKSGNVEEISKPQRTASAPRKQLSPNPAMLAVRVWKDGSVYPSQALVDKFDLEYGKATITKDDKNRNVFTFPEGQGNGLDVIDTQEWPQWKGGAGRMLFVAVTPKGAGKVDLFATTTYETDGSPKASVMAQGAATFGQTSLIPMIQEVYGIVFAKAEVKEGDTVKTPAVEGVDFVDMEVFESMGDVNVTEKFSKPILHVPKRVTRGDAKGKSDYTRRENVRVYGFAPTSILHPKTEDNSEVFPPEDEIVDMTNSSVKERNALLAG